MAIRLCLNESTADLGATLAGREADLLVVAGLLDLLGSLGEDELNVAGVGHVGVDLESERSAFLANTNSTVNLRRNVHDRGHGKCGGDPWGPG